MKAKHLLLILAFVFLLVPNVSAQSRMPGDVWCDSTINVCDLVWLVYYFAECEVSPPIMYPCPSGGSFLCDTCLANVDGDSLLDWADVWYLTYYEFVMGDPPVLCGTDPYLPTDPKSPDTLRIETIEACEGFPFELDIALANDESLYFHIPLQFSDTTRVIYDTFWTTRPASDAANGLVFDKCKGTSGILFYSSGNQPILPPGKGTLLRIFGHVPPSADTGFVSLDTTHIANDNRLSLVWIDKGRVNQTHPKRFVPQVVSGGVHIRPCVAIPGDANSSNGLGLSDIIATVNYIFNKPYHDPQPGFPTCPSNQQVCWLSNLLCRGDWSGEGAVTLADVIRGVNYLFVKPCLNPSDPSPTCWSPVKVCPSCCLPVP